MGRVFDESIHESAGIKDVMDPPKRVFRVTAMKQEIENPVFRNEMAVWVCNYLPAYEVMEFKIFGIDELYSILRLQSIRDAIGHNTGEPPDPV
jgi:hypothetical protein